MLRAALPEVSTITYKSDKNLFFELLSVSPLILKGQSSASWHIAVLYDIMQHCNDVRVLY